MPTKKTVLKWGFNCIGYDVDDEDNVTKIWCKTCREFCEVCKEMPSMRAHTGAVQPDIFAKGTSTIKKNNFQDHIKKSRAHEISVLRLTELNKMKEKPCSSETIGEAVTRPKTMMPYLRGMSSKQHNQLVKKFQLSHFLVGKAKSFQFYSEMAVFERQFHGVDMGNAYINDKACREIVYYISESVKIEKITEPLNNNTAKYYSILNDGSSSAKTMDEKELFLIKTAASGIPVFNVMSLEVPSSTTAEGLKDALDASFAKMNFNFDRRCKELGMCSDGAAVNLKLHRLIKDEIGDHYTFTHCPSHRVELAIRDAFAVSELNTESQEDVCSTYALFKRANLRWRLFKEHAHHTGQVYRKYKRPNGTRWTEHQAAGLGSFMHNLPILIGYCNNQIAEPRNITMKNLRPKLQGITNNITKLTHMIFNSMKLDILTHLTPLTKSLQSTDLILPDLITICVSVMSKTSKLSQLLDENDMSILEREDLFPTTSSLLKEIVVDEDPVIQERLTRNQLDNDGRALYMFHGYLVKGKINIAKDRCLVDFRKVLHQLVESFNDRLSSITDDDFFVAVAEILNTKNYKFKTSDEINDNIKVVACKFETLLEANGCALNKLASEIDIMHNHVLKFFRVHTPSKVWPQIFEMKNCLGISNVLHVVELCIALPIGNAETERVFSFLWRVFSKERQSLSNDALNDILRLRADTNFNESRYDMAIELFLSVHPSGEVRKRARRLDGHATKKPRRDDEGPDEGVAADDVLSQSSSEDEWTDSSDDDY